MDQPLRSRQWWVLTVCGAVLLVLIVTNMALFLGNRKKQLNINTRQQYIQQSLVLEGLNREIINALANLAVRNKDAQLIDLLTAHGITVTVNQPVARQDAPGSGPHTTTKTPSKK
jgi:hypothetical protein